MNNPVKAMHLSELRSKVFGMFGHPLTYIVILVIVAVASTAFYYSRTTGKDGIQATIDQSNIVPKVTLSEYDKNREQTNFQINEIRVKMSEIDAEMDQVNKRIDSVNTQLTNYNTDLCKLEKLMAGIQKVTYTPSPICK